MSLKIVKVSDTKIDVYFGVYVINKKPKIWRFHLMKNNNTFRWMTKYQFRKHRYSISISVNSFNEQIIEHKLRNFLKKIDDRKIILPSISDNDSSISDDDYSNFNLPL